MCQQHNTHVSAKQTLYTYILLSWILEFTLFLFKASISRDCILVCNVKLILQWSPVTCNPLNYRAVPLPRTVWRHLSWLL